tara:strand:+ start:849 stop:1007 length:159 start_codon:yes stop_codon:yes gene_type:complete
VVLCAFARIQKRVLDRDLIPLRFCFDANFNWFAHQNFINGMVENGGPDLELV